MAGGGLRPSSRSYSHASRSWPRWFSRERFDQDVASTAGRLLNYSGNQMKNFLAVREAEELERRIAELEEALERQKKEKDRGYGYTG